MRANCYCTNVIGCSDQYPTFRIKELVQIDIAAFAIAIADALIIRVCILITKDAGDIRILTIFCPKGYDLFPEIILRIRYIGLYVMTTRLIVREMLCYHIAPIG
ncbi:hypothetical protein BHU16_09615 [Tannerella sp. oral taxon 808]|nr:hypothetical protein BHU16_09615 [Tannerella sp. oral taxon 808]